MKNWGRWEAEASRAQNILREWKGYRLQLVTAGTTATSPGNKPGGLVPSFPPEHWVTSRPHVTRGRPSPPHLKLGGLYSVHDYLSACVAVCVFLTPWDVFKCPV